jgi:hypothetical protein
MQFRGSSATRGGDSGFCITIKHRDTHRLLCSNSQPPCFRISLRVTFGYSLLGEWAPRSHVSQPWRASHRMRQPNSERFQEKSPPLRSAAAGTMEHVCVCVRTTILWRWFGKRCHIFTITVQYRHSVGLLASYLLQNLTFYVECLQTIRYVAFSKATGWPGQFLPISF